MREHKVNYLQGAQTITIVASSELGLAVRPSAATIQIVDLRYPDTSDQYEVAAAVAATVDAVSTTTTAACGRSSAAPSQVTLSSVAGVAVGKRYLITNDRGESEIITAAAIDAPDKTVRAYTEPRYKYPIGSTFVGLEVSGTVAADVINDDEYLSANLHAIWTFTGVSPARVMERISIVRPLPAWATSDDVLQLEPQLGSRNAELSTALAMAHRDFATDLRLAGLDPATHRAGELGREAVTYRAAFHVLKTSPTQDIVDRSKLYDDRYRELRTGITVGRDKAGVTEINALTGAAEPVDIRSLFSGL